MLKHRFMLLALSIVAALGSIPVLLHAGLLAQASVTAVAQQATQTASVHELHFTQDGLQFTFVTPRPKADDLASLQIEGLNRQVQQLGAPSLPYYGTLIAVPPDADVSVTVQEIVVRETLLTGPISPVPHPSSQDPARLSLPRGAQTVSYPADVRLEPPPLTTSQDQDIYQRNAFYPSESFNLSTPLYYRDFRLVDLRLFPLRYNPVSGILSHITEMRVSVRFVGAERPTLSAWRPIDDVALRTITASLLNPEQALNSNWRRLPDEVLNARGTRLPVGQPVYKIELNRDGIYEISGAELAQAGMLIDQVDPAGIEMMYRGQPVAYSFLGDGDAVLESGERIRFYGSAFEGPRTDKQFVSQNVYWLWSGGAPTTIVTRTNQSGQGYQATVDFDASITREPENDFFASWTRWDTYPNEPDAWYWDYIRKLGSSPLTRTYQITLADPVPVGPDANFLVEISSRENLLAQPHVVQTYLNSNPKYGINSWYGRANVNITQTVPVTGLVDGINQVRLVVSSNASVDSLYLNRITVDYWRQLRAINDQLVFDYDLEQPREFHVSGFGDSNAADVLVWDVSQPTVPVQIVMEPANITGSGIYTYAFGSSNLGQNSRFIVTTAANILTDTSISQYIPPDLNPPDGRARWLAIAHADLITAANVLAAHRSDVPYGGMDTFVVDVADVIDQYGYGLPLPRAIQDYLIYALGAWGLPPEYVLLLGDATQNPRNLDCQAGCSRWDKDEINYLLTDLVFVDRFQGLIPSDHTFALLSGDDLLPDIAIGRIAAKNSTEALSAINKIIKFEQNLVSSAAWQPRLLFLADNADFGGNFCYENQSTGSYVPAGFPQVHLCLEPTGPISTSSVLTPLVFADVATMRAEMARQVNDTGVSMMNYRGHGSIEDWASEVILSVDQVDFWDNPDQPLVLLSADCLDGHFAWPARPGLGETFLKLAGRGSAAHWSSSGLGYTFEHTFLHTGFLEGIFSLGLTRIGDAANYSKIRYDLAGLHESELYSFVLQGDPAMLQNKLIRQNTFLPVVTNS